MNDDQRPAANGPRRRDRTARCRRPGLAVLVVAAAIGLAACSSGSSAPGVASLGTTSSGSSAPGNGSSAPSSGSSTASGSSAGGGSGVSATQLLDEWAACMRGHGDPNQSDPVINSDQDIEISMRNVSAEMAAEVHDSAGPCGHYLAQATSVLRNGQPLPAGASQAVLVKYAQCMRANGEPDYPDPMPGATDQHLPSGVDPGSAVFQNADKLCRQKAGMPVVPADVPGVVQVRNSVG
jgi:hypothetical protein